MEHMHNEAEEEQKPHSEVEGEKKSKHKEEADWTRTIGRRCSHPLSDQKPGVHYNICNDQVAPDTVNVQNALASRSEQQLSASLGSKFHKTIKRNIDLADVFQFEQSSILPALIDEYGCLR